MTGTTHHPISREDLSARLAGDRVFSGVLFAADVALDDLDFTESRFERCRFEAPTIRGADFSGAAFSDCAFAPMRIASCKLVKTRLSGCSAFDAGKRKGCTFAFCDMHGAEVIKCNLATSRFERCDLYDVNAEGSSFRGASFHQSTFTKTISRRSVLTKAVFDGCNLSFADLSGLFLRELRIPLLQVHGGIVHRHRSQPRHDAGLRARPCRVGSRQAAGRPTCAAPISRV